MRQEMQGNIESRDELALAMVPPQRTEEGDGTHEDAIQQEHQQPSDTSKKTSVDENQTYF